MVKQNKKEEIFTAAIDSNVLAQRVVVIRNQRVILDLGLAELYQVPVKRLNEQVKRNRERFPKDFMFQLSQEETTVVMRSQIATAWNDRRNTRFRPYAFTEHGVAMLSSVLRSERAIQMNIFIMRAFIELRKMLATHEDLAHEIEELKSDRDEDREHLARVSEAVDGLLDIATNPRDAIGFTVND